MKTFGYLAGLLGLAATIALIMHQGWHTIYSAIDHAGWPLFWLVPFHILPLLLDVIGWRVLLAPRDPERRARRPFLLWVAIVREACDRLLPLANVGGAIVGIRLVKLRGVNGAAAAASVIIEVLLNFVVAYLFTVLGLILLIELTPTSGTVGSILTGLIIGLPVPIALMILLRHGRMFSRLEALLERVLGGTSRLASLIEGQRLDLEVQTLYSRTWRLLAAGFMQLTGLVVGSFETWLTLRLLGYPVDIGTAVAIEAITQALRQLIFFMPAGLGVQEGGLILVGNLVGLPTDVTIALSLIKRMRELALGVPALISWQWVEARRLHAYWRKGKRSELSSAVFKGDGGN